MDAEGKEAGDEVGECGEASASQALEKPGVLV